MAGPEERDGRGAGGSGEAQAQGQSRDSTMAPVQPSLGPPRDKPRVFGLDKFNGDNFAEWSFKMENIFDHYDLLEVMEGTEKCPENDPEKSPWVRKSAQGYLLLGQALGSSQIRHIKQFQREPEKGPKAWAALKGVHAPATAAVAVVLERQMAALRIEEDEAVEEGGRGVGGGRGRGRGGRGGRGGGAANMKNGDNESESRDDRFPGQFFFVSTQAPAAPEKDESFEEPAAVGKVTLHSLDYWVIDSGATYSVTPRADMLTELELSPVKHVTSALGQRAEVKGMGKAMFKGADGKMVGLKNVLWVPNLAANLISVRRLQMAGMDTSSKGAKTYTERIGERQPRDDRFPGQLFFVSTQAPAAPEKDESFEEPAAVGKVTLHFLDYWVIDSGATYRMTPRADMLTELELSLVKHVTSALGQLAEVKGMGKAMFKGADGKMVGLKNVLWVPNLAANLISVRRLQMAGMDTSSKGAKTYTARIVVGSGYGANDGAKAKDSNNSEATAKAPLDEVVMDVVGPLKLGAAGAQYFLTIVDVYTLRSACVAKNRALTHIGEKKWVPYVEWIGRKPKVEMLRVFRCMCIALVPKHLRHNKLGAKAIWAVHLGMAQNSKGWRFWDPLTKKFLVSRDCKFMENLMYKDWKAKNEAKIGMRFGEVKSSGFEHVELPLELSSGSTTTRQSSLVNGGEEAKDAKEEEEEVQQVSERAPTLSSHATSAPRIRVTPQQHHESLHVPAAEKEGRGKRKIQAPNRLTYEALGKPAKSTLAGASMMVGDDKESEYEEFAFAFFSSVEMPREPATLKEALESSDAEEWKKAMERATIKGWVEKQMDVTTTFLNGVLEEEIFMAQPKGFDDGSVRVLKLKNALYGLKQAPRQWYLKLREVFEEIRFTSSSADHLLFMLGEGEQRSFMVVYVDDILIFSPSSDLVKEVMLKLQDKFKCKALGDVSFYLGLHIERDVEKQSMRMHQRRYLEALAANFGQNEDHVATPFSFGFKCVNGPEEESVGEEESHRFHSLVGSLMYAAVITRPDVAFATGQLARVVQYPNEEQVAAGMRVAKYLGQTPTVGLQYAAAAQKRQKGADGVEPGRLFLTAFLDASYASEREDMTSVGGFICCVGGGPTAWESKMQVDQALSSVESEYMALFRAVREIVWQRRLLAELGEEQQGSTPLYCDSQGAIALAKNPVLHCLTKHMRLTCHWTRSMVAAGEVELRYVKTTGQPADKMTKRLVEQQHWKCCKLAGMALNRENQILRPTIRGGVCWWNPTVCTRLVVCVRACVCAWNGMRA
ncbi:unnamed protein product [Closterium sp. NIES-53]